MTCKLTTVITSLSSAGTSVLAATVLFIGVAAATTALAGVGAAGPPPAQTQAAGAGHGGMFGWMSPEHVQRMAQMMANCRRATAATPPKAG